MKLSAFGVDFGGGWRTHERCDILITAHIDINTNELHVKEAQRNFGFCVCVCVFLFIYFLNLFLAHLVPRIHGG